MPISSRLKTVDDSSNRPRRRRAAAKQELDEYGLGPPGEGELATIKSFGNGRRQRELGHDRNLRNLLELSAVV